jgi:hypothetical protein
MLDLLKDNKGILGIIAAIIVAFGGSVAIRLPVDERVDELKSRVGVLEASTSRYINVHTITALGDKSSRLNTDLQLIQSQVVVIKAVLQGIDVMLESEDLRDETRAELTLQKGLLEISVGALQEGLRNATEEHRRLSQEHEQFRLEN